MSYSIMEALFSGRIMPWERRDFPSAERMALEEIIQNEQQYFSENMSPDDRKRFQNLVRMYKATAFDDEVGIYSHGFTLGALLMMEVMQKKGNMVIG